MLDTHVAIWALVTPERLPADIRGLIARPANTIYVSAVSIWEIAIKHSLGKRSAPPFSGAAAADFFQEAGFVFLDVTAEHAAAVERLRDHHSDPFDRLLVAQALTEPLRLVTGDPQVAAYDGAIISF